MYNKITLKKSCKYIEIIFRLLPRDLKFYILHFVFGEKFHIKGCNGFNEYLSIMNNIPLELFITNNIQNVIKINYNEHIITRYSSYVKPTTYMKKCDTFKEQEKLYCHYDINNLYTDTFIKSRQDIENNENKSNICIRYSCSSKNINDSNKQITKKKAKKNKEKRKYSASQKIYKRMIINARANKYEYYCKEQNYNKNELTIPDTIIPPQYIRYRLITLPDEYYDDERYIM